VLKPTLGHVAKELVGVGTLRIDSRRELLEYAGRLLDNEVPLLLTELVPGPETALEGSVAVRTRDGSYPLEYGRRKVRQWPLDYGVGSLLESAQVPETLRMNRRLMDFTGYFGISACETKRHAETGELYLIEINVRVPASFGLAEACGVDGSWRLFAALAGEELGPQPAQVDGRKVMLPQKDIQAALARIRARETSPLQVLRSWRGTRDLGALSLRDPAPAFALARQLSRKQFDIGVRKVVRRGATPQPAR
jgi:predicted ATP-grasp superfamily ATP-dependent carboligase